uniref:Uncharacterized protein n=1 Tax=Rhizophora mucronata TaxID=61149 RepID=A0A2P2Q8A0_RHIMU
MVEFLCAIKLYLCFLYAFPFINLISLPNPYLIFTFHKL